MNAVRRRADAVRNDELLLDTGVELLREKGPDRLGALDLARSADLTTGAVYSRYENTEEILVGLWQHRLAGPMRSLIETAAKVTEAGDGRDTAEVNIKRALTNPAGTLTPAISLMIAAPRIPELAEVVLPDVRRWLTDLGVLETAGDVESDRRLFTIGFMLGCLYFGAVDLFVLDKWDALLPTAHSVLDNHDVSDWERHEGNLLFDMEISTDHEIRDALVNAAARVVARSGVERATTQRIARAAGLPTSALFAEYRTRQALFEDVTTKLLGRLYRGVRGEFMIPEQLKNSTFQPIRSLNDPRAIAYRVALQKQALVANQTLLAPLGHEQRRLRLEFHLAAIHDPNIRAVLHRADKEANEHVTDLFEKIFGLHRRVVQPGVEMLRTLAQGLMLIEECTGLTQGVDTRLIFKPLYEFAVNETIRLAT